VKSAGLGGAPPPPFGMPCRGDVLADISGWPLIGVTPDWRGEVPAP
jgi:hypothetical protein